MQLVPQFNENAEHRTELLPAQVTPEPEEIFNHPSAVTLVEKIDYLYEVAQRIDAIVSQITPAQIQQANNMVNGPLGAMFSKLLGH